VSLSAVTDKAAFDEEDRVFSDGSHDVRKSLNALTNREKFDRGARLLDVLLDPCARPRNDFAIEVVDVRVRASNFEAKLDVLIRERNENVAKHRERCFGHLHKRRGIAIVAALHESNDALRNALAHIRDALEFIRDTHCGQDQSKIARNGASEGEEAHALGFEFELHLIDFSIACADLPSEFNIAIANDFDHTRNTLFDERTEREQIATKVDHS
jgi:hypothetical protein